LKYVVLHSWMKLCYLEGYKFLIFLVTLACTNRCLVLFSCRCALSILPGCRMAVGLHLSFSLVLGIIFWSREGRLKNQAKRGVGKGLLLHALFLGRQGYDLAIVAITFLLQKRTFAGGVIGFRVLPLCFLVFFLPLYSLLFPFCMLTSSIMSPWRVPFAFFIL